MQQPLIKNQPDPPFTPQLWILEFWRSFQRWRHHLSASDISIKRISTHLIVIFVIVLAVGLSRIYLFQSDGVIRPLQQNVFASPESSTTQRESGRLLSLPTTLNNFIDGIFTRAAVPRTTSPQSDAEAISANAAPEIFTYIVESGDTIYGIAAKNGLAPETIMWSNPTLENNPDLLSVGQELTILPVNGVYHQVGSGDTIEGIASTFKVDPSAIINYPLNALDTENLVIQPGQWLVVPGGTKPFIPRVITAYTGPIPDDATVGTGVFSWPTTGTIYNGYWSAHPGLDIAAYLGAPILAADAGYVIAAGWDNTGYGYSVVIDHSNGYQTLYAHLQAYYVDAGDNVVQGQQIGEMGISGNATGPHLHFEVRQGTVQRNPTGFLP